MAQFTIFPAPGIYHGIPAEMYHALPHASRSRLSILAEGRTPAHLRYEMDHPSTATRAQIIGQAVHKAVLEPEEYENAYVPALDRPKRSKADKAAWAEYEKATAPAEILSLDDWDMVAAMASSARMYPPLMHMLEWDNWIEVTVLFDYLVPGGPAIPCKARPDLYVPEIKTIVDLKTTDDASPDAFQRSIGRYNYHWQAGFYTQALQAHDIPTDHFVILAIEKKPPYLCAAYRLVSEAVEAGWAELQGALSTWGQVQESHEWPGYSPQIEDVQLPPWKMRGLYS